VAAGAPHVREYGLASHFDRIRGCCLDRGCFPEADVGALSLGGRVGLGPKRGQVHCRKRAINPMGPRNGQV
jgi:hypothetical protein